MLQREARSGNSTLDAAFVYNKYSTFYTTRNIFQKIILFKRVLISQKHWYDYFISLYFVFVFCIAARQLGACVSIVFEMLDIRCRPNPQCSVSLASCPVLLG